MAFRLKIKNQTKYSQRDLRNLVFEIARRYLDPKSWTYEIEFVPAKYYVSGYAYINGRHMKIRIPSNNKFTMAGLAFVIAHEMAHWRGMKHDQMNGNPVYDRKMRQYKEIFSWANAMPLGLKAVASKPTAEERRRAKLERARANLKKARTRAKRATTILKKWERTVKRLEKASR